MRVCLYEDRAVARLEPVALTRPAYELLCGLTALGGHQRRVAAAQTVGAVVRPHLAELERRKRPGVAVNDTAWLQAGSTLFINARWLPSVGQAPLSHDGPRVGLVDGDIAYAVVDAEQSRHLTPDNLEDHAAQWRRSLPSVEADGILIRHLWDLVNANAERLSADFAARPHRRTGYRPAGVALTGPADRAWIDPQAKLDPLVMIDTTGGPVIVARGALVTAFTRLEGPCYIGAGTQVFGAKIRAGTTLGPQCRIGGEVEASIVQGHTNKYHDGFLGHSYVGEWVNLGAGTHTSDLRLDYGPVSVVVAGELVRSGCPKIGSYLGDHVKTGLGTLMNSGTTAGPFAQLLPGGGFLPKCVPAFTRSLEGRLSELTDLNALLETATRVMHRRERRFTPAHEAMIRALHAQTAAVRWQTLRDAEQRSLRKSA